MDLEEDIVTNYIYRLALFARTMEAQLSVYFTSGGSQYVFRCRKNIKGAGEKELDGLPTFDVSMSKFDFGTDFKNRLGLDPSHLELDQFGFVAEFEWNQTSDDDPGLCFDTDPS